MRKKIMFGCLLAVFLMMMLPSAYAVESNATKEAVESQSPITISKLDIEELREKYANNPYEPTCIIITFLIWFLRVVQVSLFAFWIFVIYSIIKRITNNTACIIS